MAENDNLSEDQVREQERAFAKRQTEQGPAARRAQISEGDEFAIAGDARKRGEDPSPDDRERGETSVKDREPPVDIHPGPVRKREEGEVMSLERRRTTDEEPDSALGGGTATRSGTAPTPPEERGD